MSVLPASSGAFSAELLSSLGSTQASVQHLGQELATGSSILSPSDNPPAAVASLRAQAAAARVSGYLSSATDGLNRLSLANSTMNSVLSGISQARQAVLSVSTATTSPVGMASLATKVSAIATSLLTEANTSYEGYAIFGGTSGVTQAFDQAGNYAGNSVVSTRTVAAGTQLAVGVPGSAVFGSGSSGLFGVLAKTAADLQAGNVNAVLGTDLHAINSWYSTAQGAAATLGGQYDQMQAAKDAASGAASALAQQVSNLSSVNLPKVLTELRLRQSSLQAALWATSRAASVSILSYLP